MDAKVFLDLYSKVISKAVNKWLVDHDCGQHIRDKQKDAEHECFLYLMEDDFGKLNNIKDISKTEQFIWICAYRRASWFFMKEIDRLLAEEEMSIPEGKTEVEVSDAIKEAIESLDVTSKNIIKKYYYEGFTHKQIAYRLGITAGNAAVRLCRALRELKKTMKEMGYDVN